MPQIMAYQPQHYKDFACLGPGCRDTCCRNRAIGLEKKDYDRYMSFGDEALRRKLEEHISAEAPSPFKARVKMAENGFCPFLDSAGLCEIHAKCGRRSLCHDCKTYPRVLCNVGGEMEAFLDMSCEEAARLALLNPDIMKMALGPAEYDNYVGFALDAEAYTPSEDGAGIFWNLRIASAHALQNRRYPVWLRMVILGLFIKQADEYIAAGQESELAELSLECMDDVSEGVFDGYAGQIPDRPDLKAELALLILERAGEIAPGEGDGMFGRCLAQAREGLGASGAGRPVREITDNLTGACRRHYAPFFRDREYIFENYLVNAVFMTGFPFTYEKEGSVYKNYVNLAVRYVALKLLLNGMAGYHRHEFSEDCAVRAVAAFARASGQNDGVAGHIAEKLETLGMTEMGRMCLLLKD